MLETLATEHEIKSHSNKSIKSKDFRKAITLSEMTNVSESDDRNAVVKTLDFWISSLRELYQENRKHLSNALSQLHNIDEQFEPDDIRPTQSLLKNVESLIYRLFDVSDLPFDVLATPEGDVIVSCSTQLDNMLFLECAPKGNVYCMVKIDGERTRQSYLDISKIPDSYIANSVKLIHRVQD